MPKNYIMCLWIWKEVQDKVCWLKEMIWAGLTDHLMCKPELFLDNRFQVITLIMVDHGIQCYLEPIVQPRSYCRSPQKVENKSFKSGGQIWISDQRLDQNLKTWLGRFTVIMTFWPYLITVMVKSGRHQAERGRTLRNDEKSKMAIVGVQKVDAYLNQK